MTPAQRAGIVMGKKYKVHAPAIAHAHGGIYVLSRDDGTTLPYFELAEGYTGPQDQRACVYVDGTDGATLTEVTEVAEEPTDFHVSLNPASTTIVIQKRLTMDELQAVLKAAGL